MKQKVFGIVANSCNKSTCHIAVRLIAQILRENLVSTFLLLASLYLMLVVFLLSTTLMTSKTEPLLCRPQHFMDNEMNSGVRCPEGVPLHVVVIVNSARFNFDLRRGIRETWGNLEHYHRRGYRVKVFFFVGMAVEVSDSLEATLATERSLFNDVLVVNTDDNYMNNIHKHIFSLNFVKQKCSDAELVVKADDDVFIDLVGLLMLTKTNSSVQGSIVCSKNINGPVRDPNMRWYVDHKVFDGDFPHYCLGSFYSLNMTTTSVLSSLANCNPFFWIDDVFVTGVLRHKAGIPIHSLESLALVNAGYMEEELMMRYATVDAFLLVYHDKLDRKKMHLLYDVYLRRLNYTSTLETPKNNPNTKITQEYP